MNIFFAVCCLLADVAFASSALGQASATTLQISATTTVDSSLEYNKHYEKLDKILHNREFKDDNKLTDLRLRAQGGSLSHYSISSSMNLKGPTIGEPSSSSVPNPDKKIQNEAQTLSGNVSARYRLDSDHSLGFGTGLSFNHPLQGVDRTDISRPFVAYNIANRVRDVQMLLSPSLSVTTSPENQAVGQVAGATIMANFVKDLGASRFAFSMETRGTLVFYNRGYDGGKASSSSPGTAKHQGGGTRRPANGGDGNSQQYSIEAGPGMKYHVTDRLDISTFLSIPFYNPMASEDISVLLPNSPTASLGLGWAYNRDIYISPGLQTYPTKLSPDLTTLSVSMIFSVL